MASAVTAMLATTAEKAAKEPALLGWRVSALRSVARCGCRLGGRLRGLTRVVRRLSLGEPLEFPTVEEHPLTLFTLVDRDPAALVLAHRATAFRTDERLHDSVLPVGLTDDG